MERTKKRHKSHISKWVTQFFGDTHTYRKGDGPLVTVVGGRYFSVDPREVLYLAAKRGDMKGVPGFSKKTNGKPPDTKPGA